MTEAEILALVRTVVVPALQIIIILILTVLTWHLINAGSRRLDAHLAGEDFDPAQARPASRRCYPSASARSRSRSWWSPA